MSRTLKIVLAVVVVLAIAGGLGAWYIFGGDTPKKLALTDSPSKSTNSTKPVSTAGTWQVSKTSVGTINTVVGYRVNEKFAGGLATTTAVGRTSDVTGKLIVAGNAITAANITADLTNLQSDRAQRDAAMHNRGLQTNTFPNATYALSTPVQLPKVQPGKVFTVKASGRLTIHGVTRTITESLKGKASGSTFIVQGEIPIRMKDYKIDPPSIGGFVTVEDHGLLELELILAKA